MNFSVMNWFKNFKCQKRKLNKDFEKNIFFKKNVELVLAKIYDIDDEVIQKEYVARSTKLLLI